MGVTVGARVGLHMDRSLVDGASGEDRLAMAWLCAHSRRSSILGLQCEANRFQVYVGKSSRQVEVKGVVFEQKARLTDNYASPKTY